MTARPAPLTGGDSFPASMEGRIAVLVSGSGTNLQALLDDREIGPRIVVVASDRPGVRALERAEAAMIETVVIAPASLPTRDALTDVMRDAMLDRSVDLVVNAGYMRILGTAFAEAFAGRWLNVHPSLLPAFPGAHAIRDALDAGVKVTGVTVHLADEGVDTGPVVLQEALEITDSDDMDSLTQRIHEIEHRLLPRAVRAALEGRLKMEGGRVHMLEEIDD
jgi:phosphoribosylglycinamide formyltransferase-1